MDNELFNFILFYEINSLITEGHVKLIKSDRNKISAIQYDKIMLHDILHDIMGHFY